MLNQAVAFPADCPKVSVLHDKNGEGWKNGCLGLKEYPKITSAMLCEKACKEDSNCAVWQYLKKIDKPGAPKEGCWYGYPDQGCRTRGAEEIKKAHGATDFQLYEEALMAGQRLQHGTIKPIGGVKGVEVAGLTQKFTFEDKESDDLKKERCKAICYSDITCGVWQVYQKDKVFTCLVEHAPNSKAGATGTDAKPEFTDGQKIEHVCPPPPKKEKPKPGLPWKYIIPGIILGLLSIAACIYSCQKKPKVKKTRAIKVEHPKPEPTPVTYFVPQPTVLIPQQSVIMAQPVVQQPLMTTYTTERVVQQPVVQQATTAYAAPTTAYTQPTSGYSVLR